MKPDRATRPRPISRSRKLLFVLVANALMFASLEGLCTVFGWGEPFLRAPKFWSGAMPLMQPDEKLGVKMRPFAELGPVRLNSLGFRDDERIVSETAEVNVLSLGDSTTFGWGLGSSEGTYSQKLERLLERRLGKSVEVFNAGVPSYTMYQGLQLYFSDLADLRSWDVVIVTFGWNDTPGGELDLEFAMRRPPVESAWLREGLATARNLRLFNVAEDLFLRMRFDPSGGPVGLTRQQYERDLETLVVAAKRRGARVIVMPALVRPLYEGTPMAIRVEGLNETAEAIALRQQVEWLAVNEAFDAKADDIRWFDDVHYDALGHGIIARELADWIAVVP